MTETVFVFTQFHSPWNGSEFIAAFKTAEAAKEYAKSYFGEDYDLKFVQGFSWYSIFNDEHRVGTIQATEVRG